MKDRKKHSPHALRAACPAEPLEEIDLEAADILLDIDLATPERRFSGVATRCIL